MDPGSILLGLAILVLLAVFVLRPLREPARLGWGAGDRQFSELQAERERILDALREVDLDHSMGKLLPEDYRAQRQDLTARGAEVLRQLDELDGSARWMERSEAPATGRETELEAVVRRLRSRRAAGFCGQCGNRLLPGDRFCPNCGAPVPDTP